MITTIGDIAPMTSLLFLAQYLPVPFFRLDVHCILVPTITSVAWQATNLPKYLPMKFEQISIKCSSYQLLRQALQRLLEVL